MVRAPGETLAYPDAAAVMTHSQRASPVSQTMRTEDRLYVVSRCTKAPGGTPCRGRVNIGDPRRDKMDPDNYQYESSCLICTCVKYALFQRLEHTTRALEKAANTLRPELSLPPIGEHWNASIAQLQPLPQPIARQMAKAFVMRSGVNHAFRRSVNAA